MEKSDLNDEPSIRRRRKQRGRHSAAQLRQRRRGREPQRHEQLAADGAICLGGGLGDLWPISDGKNEGFHGKMMKHRDFMGNLEIIPSGNLTQLLKMAIYSWFSH